MLSGVSRVVIGFVAAVLAAATVQVLFAHPPAEIIDTGALAGRRSLAGGMDYLLQVAAIIGVFALSFVAIAVAVSEGLHVQGLPFYLVTGLGIAGMGLYARMKGEDPGDPSILNAYAMLAYATAGLAGGVVYWWLAGWRAGGRASAWDKRADAGPRAPALAVEPDTTAASSAMPVASSSPTAPATPPSPPPPPRFTIERTPPGTGPPRLFAAKTLERSDFEDIAEAAMVDVRRARKIGLVAARKADQELVVGTHWNGKETTNTARPGDWIVTNMSAEKELLRDDDGNVNTYVIKAETFPLLYQSVEGENEHGAFYKSIAVVDSIQLPGGFDIVAPWGERQRADKGYLIMNGRDIYGNHADTFEASYAILP